MPGALRDDDAGVGVLVGVAVDTGVLVGGEVAVGVAVGARTSRVTVIV